MGAGQAFNQLLGLVVMGMVGTGAFYALYLFDRFRSPGGSRRVVTLAAAVLVTSLAVLMPGVRLLRSEPPPFVQTRLGAEHAGLPLAWAYQGPVQPGAPHWLESGIADEHREFGLFPLGEAGAIHPLLLLVDLGVMAALGIALVEAVRWLARRLRPSFPSLEGPSHADHEET